MSLYLLTVTCQQKKAYIDKSMLDECIDYIKFYVSGLHIELDVYENSGKYRQLHYHAIARVPKEFRYNTCTGFGAPALTRVTFQIHWKPITSIIGAVNYLEKDLKYKTQDDIFRDNYYSVNRFGESYLE